MNAYPLNSMRYKSRADFMNAWLSGRDFICERGYYFSIRDKAELIKLGNDVIYFHYNNSMNGIARVNLHA